jgi:hypothetical protein
MTPESRKPSRKVWLLVGGGAVLFVVCALQIAHTHSNVYAKTLVNRAHRRAVTPVRVNGGCWGLCQTTPPALPPLRMAVDHTVSDSKGMPAMWGAVGVAD